MSSYMSWYCGRGVHKSQNAVQYFVHNALKLSPFLFKKVVLKLYSAIYTSSIPFPSHSLVHSQKHNSYLLNKSYTRYKQPLLLKLYI